MRRQGGVENIRRCPHCGSDRFAMRVLTWANYKGGVPHSFDQEDIDYVEPVPGEKVVCRCCGRYFDVGQS